MRAGRDRSRVPPSGTALDRNAWRRRRPLARLCATDKGGNDHGNTLRIAGPCSTGLGRGACLAAAAQNYPERPIRMIVSIAAGSLTDVIMRAAANELAPRLGQPVVIENRGGAAGIPGAQACAASAGDGYTICVVFHNQLSFNPVMFTNLPYDVDKDLVLITRLFFLIESLAVHPSINVNTVAELRTLAQSKRHEAQLGHARPGLGARAVPALDQQPVAHRHRRHSLSRRRPDGAGAGRERYPGRRRGLGQFSGTGRRRQDQAPRSVGAAPFAARAERDDVPGSRPRWLQAARLVGPCRAEGHAGGAGRPASTPSSCGCSAIRTSSPSSTSRRWLSAPTTPAEFAAFVKEDRVLRRKPRQAREHAGAGVQARRAVAPGSVVLPACPGRRCRYKTAATTLKEH